MSCEGLYIKCTRDKHAYKRHTSHVQEINMCTRGLHHVYKGYTSNMQETHMCTRGIHHEYKKHTSCVKNNIMHTSIHHTVIPLYVIGSEKTCHVEKTYFNFIYEYYKIAYAL